jgi:trehalose-phosphatase
VSTRDALPPDVLEAVGAISATSHLLVAVDVDGTISEIAPRPQDAFVLPGALDALRDLAREDGTTVAVLSGRARQDLESLVPLGADVVLAGSHGVERATGVALDPEQTTLRAQLVALVEEVAASVPGALVEPKPTGAALHVRLAEEQDGAAALARLRRRVAEIPGAHLRTGKAVLELSAVPTGKGPALVAIRTECGADAVLFVGDDDTDEEAFAALGEQDLGVKVGAGATAAGVRVTDPSAVVALLEAVVRARRNRTRAPRDRGSVRR